MKKFFTATVINCEGSKKIGVFYLTLKKEQPLGAKPGQFVMLQSFFADKIWQRPFSVFLQGFNYFATRIQVKGENTEHYARLKPGDKISVKGPLGKPITVASNYKKVILVVGGAGIAGIMLLISKLKELSVEITCLYGGKGKLNKIDKKLLKIYGCKLETITDEEGLVTDLLEKELKTGHYNRNDRIIACGPNAMLEKVAIMALRYGMTSLVGMETLVACGEGAYKGCPIPKKGGGYYHLCQDGPFLSGMLVDWEKVKQSNISLVVPEEERMPVKKINMKTVLVGQGGKKLILPSPIITCAGCLDLEAVENGMVDISKAGAITTKGLSLLPRVGNEGPRIAEVPGGMLNAIGLENVGLEVFLKDKLSHWLSFKKTVIVNIFGNSVDEYAELAEILYKHGIRVFEVNISCPNKKQNEEIFALSPKSTFRVVKAVRLKAPEAFIITKLSPIPDGEYLKKIALMAVKGGSDALACFNTYPGLKVNLETGRAALGNTYGGYSGPGAMPIALRKLRILYEMKLGISLIGQTGVDSGDSAAEYMVAGAPVIGIGTALLYNPEVLVEIHNGLRGKVAAYGMSNIKELVGSMVK
ncbi:MAG: FAD-binding oxidoreductase [Patescibacteria group bacterium]|jgi:dihydroorotate dehydrogenase (NAD+) catalytic subunit